MPSIEFLGHAGLAVEHGGSVLLCDPWLSPDGAYLGSWFPFPHYDKPIPERYLSPDAIYVSHEHLDHFDAKFLSSMDRGIPIITGRFDKKRLVHKLRRLGFRHVIELEDLQGFRLSDDFEIRVVSPTFNCPPHWFDSSALIEAGGIKIFNMNDSGLALPFDRIRAEQIDVFMGQASPAIWYPLTYANYDEEERRELMRIRRESAVESFVAAINAIQPKLAVPFAGPPCFFDGDLAHHFLSPDSMFGSPTRAAEVARRETGVPTEVLKPGDRLHFDNGTIGVDRNPTYRDFDYDKDRITYFNAHRADKLDRISGILNALEPARPDLFERFRDHFVPLIERHPYFSARINMRVLFDVTGENGGRWMLDLRDLPRTEYVKVHADEPVEYVFTIESRFVEQVIREELSWEDLFLSLRFTAYRSPDRYNQHLFTFLKMADSRALRMIAEKEVQLDGRTEYSAIRVEHEGKRYTVQRFCPHAGADLQYAEVVDGCIVCPNHHWRFELATGKCLESDYWLLTIPEETNDHAAASADTAGTDRGSRAAS